MYSSATNLQDLHFRTSVRYLDGSGTMDMNCSATKIFTHVSINLQHIIVMFTLTIQCFYVDKSLVVYSPAVRNQDTVQ